MLTRPTMSLSLYLQMVGRGLRPKQDDGDCVILDLAGNSLRHGLPDEERDWSLQPRSKQPSGKSPVVWCPKCESLSPAGSHQCRNCGAPFGGPCDRCGAWRAWIRWSRKTVCGKVHDLVCDLCHYDAHIQAQLPVTEELKELAMLANDDELSPDRDPFLKNFLGEERRRVVGGAEERKDELRSLIGHRESELSDDKRTVQVVRESPYRTAYGGTTAEPGHKRVGSSVNGKVALSRNSWGGGKNWPRLNLNPSTVRLIFNNARDRLLRLLEAEAREAGLLPQSNLRETPLRTMLEEPSPSRLAKGLLTPAREFTRPILESLVELGGSAKGSLVFG